MRLTLSGSRSSVRSVIVFICQTIMSDKIIVNPARRELVAASRESAADYSDTGYRA